MSKTVASMFCRARKQIAWVAMDGIGHCDFGDNKVGIDSYFDEADMSS